MVDQLAYTERSGGHANLQHNEYIQHRRELAIPGFRESMRRKQRREIIEGLAEKTGLPFHLAICNIALWRESEREPLPWSDPNILPDDRPVLLTIDVYVREVRWPEGMTQEAP